MVRPNLFLIGAPKCGTTSLCTYLGAHPSIFVCDPKEPGFTSGAGRVDANGEVVYSLERYLALFADAERIPWRCDASTDVFGNDGAIDRIEAMCSGTARYIVMLRNPVDMVVSLFREECFSMNEDQRRFECAWRLQEARAAGRCIPARCISPDKLQYRRIAQLGTHLEQLLARIPRTRVCVVLLDDLRVAPRSAYLRVLTFLGLPDDDRVVFGTINAAKQHRLRWLAALLWRPPPRLAPVVNACRYTVRAVGLRGLRSRMMQYLSRPASREVSLPPGLRRELVEEFAGEVTKLEWLLGRSLTEWRV